MGIILPKLRQSARGQVCTFMLPGCTDRDTTVLCHCRIGHAGMSTKPDDWFSAFGCFSCHQSIDNHTADDEARIWLRAIQRTQRIWFDEGLMSFPETATKPRVVGKIVPRPAQFRR